MRFSIIVPVYNVERYLRKCLESVLLQTMGDFELILVDDGSTDKSGSICDEYAQRDSRIVVIHQQNAGQAFARNRAIDIAQGEYIAFLDSDDWWINDSVLSKISDCVQQSDFVFFDLMMIPDGNSIEEGKVCPFTQYADDTYVSGKDFLLDILSKRVIYPWYPPQYVFRKALWLENGIRFPEGMVYEDAATIYKAVLNSKTVKVIHECFYCYRTKRRGATTQVQTFSSLSDMLKACTMTLDDLNRNWTLPFELFRKMAHNCAVNYLTVLIRSTQLNKVDRNRIWGRLEEERWVLTYLVYGKQVVAKKLIEILGIPFTGYLLGIRRVIKQYVFKR